MKFSRTHHFGLATLCTLAIILLASCATIPNEVFETEPASQFEISPQIYVRLSGDALRDMAANMSDEEMASLIEAVSPKNPGGSLDTDDSRGSGKAAASMDTSMLEGFLAKTRTFGAGIRGIGTTSPAMEAVFVGDFPVASIRIALALDGNWQKSAEGGYRSIKYPIFLRPPQPGIIHAASTEVPAGAGLVEIEAYPKKFSDLAASDIFISANSPTAFFSGLFPMEASSIPVSTVIVTGRRMPAGYVPMKTTQGKSPLTAESRYLLDIRIMMKDEATARAYKPVVKFLWTAAASKLFGDTIDLSSTPLVLENDIYIMRGLEVEADGLRTMLTASLVGR